MTFAQAMRQVGYEYELVKCGHESFLFQTREQWTDGANLFAIAPGVLLGYDRNEETIKALKARQQKYDYLNALDHKKEIDKIAEDFRKNTTTERRIIIGLPGSELSRARGGPRCMTMPLQRDRL